MYVDWEYYKIFYYVAKYQNFLPRPRGCWATTSPTSPTR